MKSEIVRIESREQNMLSRIVSTVSADLGHSAAELTFLSKLHEFREMLMPEEYRERNSQGMALYLESGKGNVLGLAIARRIVFFRS